MFDAREDLERVVDGLETVVLTNLAGGTTNVPAALRRMVRTQEAAPSDGRLLQHDVVWHLPSVFVADRPELGATITDSAAREWSVLAVDEGTPCGRWSCRTRNMILAHGLFERVAIEAPSYRSDAHGAPRVDWSPFRTCVPARIQPFVRQTQRADGAQFDLASHVVYITGAWPPATGYRVRDGLGRTFVIERIVGAERLGELTELHARQLT